MRYWEVRDRTMKILLTIIVTFFAGMGAGLGTRICRNERNAVISPMLITFLGDRGVYGGGEALPCHRMYWQVQCLPIRIRKMIIWISIMD